MYEKNLGVITHGLEFIYTCVAPYENKKEGYS